MAQPPKSGVAIKKSADTKGKKKLEKIKESEAKAKPKKK